MHVTCDSLLYCVLLCCGGCKNRPVKATLIYLFKLKTIKSSFASPRNRLIIVAKGHPDYEARK